LLSLYLFHFYILLSCSSFGTSPLSTLPYRARRVASPPFLSLSSFPFFLCTLFTTLSLFSLLLRSKTHLFGPTSVFSSHLVRFRAFAFSVSFLFRLVSIRGSLDELFHFFSSSCTLADRMATGYSVSRVERARGKAERRKEGADASGE